MVKYKKADIIIFIAVIMLHTLNQLIKNEITYEPAGYLLRNHFNDFLGGIGIIAYIDFWLCISKYHIHISKNWIILLIGFLCGLFWEFITPIYRPESVSDLWDIVAYVMGAGAYALLISIMHRLAIKL